MANQYAIQNRLLAGLPTDEYARFFPHLEEIELTYDSTICHFGDAIRYVYFPSSGIISLLGTIEDGSTLISCVIGNEGMVGLPLFLGAKTAPVHAIVQGSGKAMRMAAADFENECRESSALPGLLLHFTYSLMVQILQSTVCYRFCPVEKRLARWLLMTHDRMGTDGFQMTQNFLTSMVGVRRETIAHAAISLRKKSLVRYSRGNMMITDRPGLEAATCKCYSVTRTIEKSQELH